MTKLWTQFKAFADDKCSSSGSMLSAMQDIGLVKKILNCNVWADTSGVKASFIYQFRCLKKKCFLPNNKIISSDSLQINPLPHNTYFPF